MFCDLDEEKQFFKVKSVFKVPEEPKKVVPEEKFPKLKPRREAEPPAKGTLALPRDGNKLLGLERSRVELVFFRGSDVSAYLWRVGM